MRVTDDGTGVNRKGKAKNRTYPVVLRIFLVLCIIAFIIFMVAKISGLLKPDVQEENPGSMEYIAQTIMDSKIAGYVGKSKADIEAEYGPIQNEGVWYNGLLYTQHKNFSGDFGYGNADPAAVIETIESDSICNAIVLRLSEIMTISNISIDKDELQFINNDSEGDYFYVFKNIDVPIRIDCDESGNIEKDPWIVIYLKA